MTPTIEGTWLDGNLHIWAHVCRGDVPRAPLPSDDLRAAIADWAPDPLLVSAGSDSELEIRPPAADTREDAATESLVAPSLAFQPAEALELLAGARASGAAWSPGLQWWAGLARFTAGLLTRRQFIPDVERDGDGRLLALWRPHLSSRRAVRWLEQAAGTMPGVCTVAAADDAIAVVEAFVETAIDGFIRRTTAEDAFFDGIHERAEELAAAEVRWLSALLGDEPELRGIADADTFVDRVRAWTGRLGDFGSPEDLQLCFVLHEPQGNDAPWRVGLHLESRDDGRRVDIRRVWTGPSGHPTLLRRHLGRRRDRLLAALSEAEDDFPALRRLSRQHPPDTVLLDVHEAHMFIREWAPLLGGRGFGVTLPPWARLRENRVGLRLMVRPQSSGGASTELLGLDQLVSFDWRVAVGDAELSPDEFEQLATHGAPLIRHGDTWLEIDAHEARRALEFVRREASGTATLRDALQLAHGIAPKDAGLPLVGVSGRGWLEELLRDLQHASAEPPQQPAAFAGTLRDYQRRGLGWLLLLDRHGIGGCLADDMGLGKTIQVIALLLSERERGPCGPTLLFAPTSVLGNWKRELERFAPALRARVHHGPERPTDAAFAYDALRHDVIITTYALGHRDLETLQAVRWHRLVLDEAQKVKNPHAQQTVAIRRLAAGRRVALTGTPVENHLSDLWSIMEVLNPGLLGPPGHFRSHFVVPIEKMGDDRRARQLRGVLRPFLLRREKSDPAVIRDLPERMDMRVYCNLTPEQARLYERTTNDMLGDIQASAGIGRRGLVLALLTRLKQICNHPAQIGAEGPLDGRSGKCERLIEMLEEVYAEGDSALVFTQYRRTGDLLEQLITRRLPDVGLHYLHGGTPAGRRQRMIDAFQNAAGGEVFILSLRAGGFGVNLTAANHVFHFDRWWNPAVEDQATDRAHRVGQTRVVQVHKFVCIGTVEERIDELLQKKKHMAGKVVASGEHVVTEMATDELRAFLQLGREAVG